MHSYLRVNNKKIGNSFPAYIIAEVGQTHCGSLKKALSYIKRIADTGADAVGEISNSFLPQRIYFG